MGTARDDGDPSDSTMTLKRRCAVEGRCTSCLLILLTFEGVQDEQNKRKNNNNINKASKVSRKPLRSSSVAANGA